MRAVVCHEFGPLGSLTIEERESPPLYPGCVRVAVTACGVNYVDGLFVQGKYQIKPPVPFVPGMEVVGRVTEVADDVEGWALGDRVFANVGLGGYADEAVVAASRAVRLPDGLTDGQAATFMQSYLTGWFALRERARVRAGQSMLVLGAGGGVGLAAVDIGVALGMRVIAAASTEAKRELARARGAHTVIDTSTLDASGVKEAAKAFGDEVERTGGVDVIYDPIGGDAAATHLRALGEDGQYLVIGFVAGIPRLPANQILLRNRRVTGVDWGAWAGRNPAENERLLAEVLGLIEAGRLHPVEPVTYPLDDAVKALADLADRKVAGKVALIP
jgi:NADPH2:quinone reductase